VIIVNIGIDFMEIDTYIGFYGKLAGWRYRQVRAKQWKGFSSYLDFNAA